MFDSSLEIWILKVRGQISLYCGSSIIFGLSDFPVSEFELVAEELLMSDSVIKVEKLLMVVAFLLTSLILEFV